jgi:hypothetical protein
MLRITVIVNVSSTTLYYSRTGFHIFVTRHSDIDFLRNLDLQITILLTSVPALRGSLNNLTRPAGGDSTGRAEKICGWTVYHHIPLPPALPLCRQIDLSLRPLAELVILLHPQPPSVLALPSVRLLSPRPPMIQRHPFQPLRGIMPPDSSSLPPSLTPQTLCLFSRGYWGPRGREAHQKL